MAYIDIADVERRLGLVLNQSEAERLQAFLDDYKVFLDATLRAHKKNPEDMDAAIIKLVVAKHAVNYVLTADLTPGISSISRASGDTSESMGIRSDITDRLILTNKDKELLGLNGIEFFSIQMETDRPRRGWY